MSGGDVNGCRRGRAEKARAAAPGELWACGLRGGTYGRCAPALYAQCSGAGAALSCPEILRCTRMKY